jgi:anti-sigma-28 factor FlgM
MLKSFQGPADMSFSHRIGGKPSASGGLPAAVEEHCGMKIQDRNLAGAAPAETARSQEAQKLDREGRQGAVGKSGSGDRVELSGVAGSISRALAASSTDRAARVSALAADYRAGRYTPDSRATSRGMIKEALAGGVA